MKRTSVAGMLAAIVLSTSTASLRAEVSIDQPAGGERTRILIEGSLDWAAADQFVQQADKFASAVVYFNSASGDLLAALIVGQTIHQKGFATAVDAQAQCSSACALAWLGGVERSLARGGRIRFNVSEAQSVSLAAYFHEIGLSDQAAKFFMEPLAGGVGSLDHKQAESLRLTIPPRAIDSELPSGSLWSYNGSTLSLMVEGAQRKFSYEDPRAELIRIGVARGTLLFVGLQTGRVYRGILLLFSQRCGAIPYHVRGELSEDKQSIVLRGKAPSVNLACRVETTWDATSLFVRSAKQLPTPVSSSPRAQ